jgi:hypothetical protein
VIELNQETIFENKIEKKTEHVLERTETMKTISNEEIKLHRRILESILESQLRIIDLLQKK